MELQRKIERSKWTRTLVVACGLGMAALVTACGSGSVPEAEQSTYTGPEVSADYFDNGTRILRYTGDADNFADVFQYCDGLDLLEQTEFLKHGYGAAGNGVERTVAYPACSDGALTESDFQIIQ